MSQTRTAAEVLLAIENQLKKVVSQLESQDLLLKILSNKIGELSRMAPTGATQPPKFKVEAADVAPLPSTLDPERNVKISAESSIPVEKQPSSFRRSSRPETYAGDDSYLNPLPKPKEEVKFPIQIPKPTGQVEIMPHAEAMNPTKLPQPEKTGNAIPVTQRVVNSSGKSLFLADVEITDLATMERISKTRTNGTGKWSAPLPVGNYRVTIRKREPTSKEQLETAQDITVDGSSVTLELPMLIIKK